jgi:hypothetical protein
MRACCPSNTAALSEAGAQLTFRGADLALVDIRRPTSSLYPYGTSAE